MHTYIKINIRVCLERFLKLSSLVIIYNQTKHAMSIFYAPVIVLSIVSTLSHLTYQPYKKLTPNSDENMPG